MAGGRPVTWHVLPGSFGAIEVRGLDVVGAERASLGSELRDALTRHAVVCIRLPGPLSPDEEACVGS